MFLFNVFAHCFLSLSSSSVCRVPCHAVVLTLPDAVPNLRRVRGFGNPAMNPFHLTQADRIL